MLNLDIPKGEQLVRVQFAKVHPGIASLHQIPQN